MKIKCDCLVTDNGKGELEPLVLDFPDDKIKLDDIDKIRTRAFKSGMLFRKALSEPRKGFFAFFQDAAEYYLAMRKFKQKLKNERRANCVK
jgi:hypothetical protein